MWHHLYSSCHRVAQSLRRIIICSCIRSWIRISQPVPGRRRSCALYTPSTRTLRTKSSNPVKLSLPGERDRKLCPRCMPSTAASPALFDQGEFLSPRKVPEGGGWRPSEDRLLHGTVAPHHPDTSVSSPGGPGSLSLHGCHEDEQSSSTPFRALLLLEGTGCRSAWGAMGQQPAASPPTPAPPLLPGP